MKEIKPRCYYCKLFRPFYVKDGKSWEKQHYGMCFHEECRHELAHRCYYYEQVENAHKLKEPEYQFINGMLYLD